MSKDVMNGQNEQGSDFVDLMKIFNEYEKRNANSEKKFSKDEILQKYFVPQDTKQPELFRLLPPLPGRELLEFAFFHEVRVNTSKGKTWKKIYCPAHNSPKVPKLNEKGEPYTDQNGKPVMITPRCPLCEKKNAILAKQIPLVNENGKFYKKEDYSKLTEEQKKIKENNDKLFKDAMEYSARKYYIIRGIDKGKTKDGVKFWRFKEKTKGQGVLDKLIPALKGYINDWNVSPHDIEKGADLTITVVEVSKPGNNGTYKDVSSISTRKPSKLSDDPVILNQWLSDKTTWRDVFKPTVITKVINFEEYLERIANGTDPYWDEVGKRFVFPSPADAALQEAANNRQSLEATRNNDIQMASDLVNVFSTPSVDISNVTKEDVGTFKDDALDVTASLKSKLPSKQEEFVDDEDIEEEDDDGSTEIYDGVIDDDLPF